MLVEFGNGERNLETCTDTRYVLPMYIHNSYVQSGSVRLCIII